MALAFDQVTTNSTFGGSASYSVTCTGSNLVLVVGVTPYHATLANRTVSTITYNSVSLTKIRADEVSGATGQRSELWYLLAPTTGANTLVITMGGGSVSIDSGAISFTGALQTTSVINVSGTNTTAAGVSISNSLTTTVDNAYIVDACACGIGPGVANAGQTLKWSQSTATSLGSIKGPNTPTGAYSTGYSDGLSNENWVISSVAIAPADAVATIPNKTYQVRQSINRSNTY